MYKIFYNPKTLKIMGMSDGVSSLEFPYIETEKKYHSLENLEIIKNGEVHELKLANNKLKLSDYSVGYKKKRRMKKDRLLKKMKEGKVDLEYLANYILTI